jgi:heterodisulfide reductase subunit A
MSEEVKIGVFVCDCGSNIAGVVDVPAVVDYARGLDHVVVADEGRWSCSVDYLSRLQRLIKEHELNRVVIASCTPRTHEPLFKATTREAGLNPYLLEFVSIREQVSWVHMAIPEAATAKAKDLVKMGVAKAALLEEGEEIRLPVGSDCLVIGGGAAGMTTALNVADQGFRAVIVEKRAELGGLLNRIDTISTGSEVISAASVVTTLAERVAAHPHIEVYTNSEIDALEGYLGNYKVTLRSASGADAPPTLEISTIVVATGMSERAPTGFYGYGEDSRVVTQLELEALIASKAVTSSRKVVIVNCVDSKNDKRGCCNVGCTVAVKNALAIKALDSDIEVHILYRDLSMLKDEHHHVEVAKRAGIKFLRFPDQGYPELVDGADSVLTVRVRDLLLGRDLDVEADLLVLTTGFCGDESVPDTKGHLKVSANADGFFQESHVKLGPVEFSTDGISLCGCAKSPKTLKESCEEGIAAAMRVSIPMRNGFIEAAGIVADIDLTDCTPNCTLCAKKCPYSAILLSDAKEPSVLKALCKGCGLCVADCPQSCVTMVHYTDEQLLAQVEAALEDDPGEKIVGFVCHWCALGGVDMAGVSRLQYPPNARLIRVMCSARVPIKLITRAYELGAGGVLVAGCEFPTCHYITGNYACEKRMKRASKQLDKRGFDSSKLWNIWCSAADGPKFANAMRDMVKELGLDGGEK